MKNASNHWSQIAKLAAAASLLGVSSSVFAVSTWTFGDVPCQPTFTSCTASSTNEGAAAAKITQASAYSTTGSGSVFAAATLTDQNTNGLGVQTTTVDEGTPQHAMDNNGYTDLMVFKFDKSVILDKVRIGWSQTDADISVLRWTGASDPTLGSALANKTVANLTSTANTWSLVGHYGGTASGDTNFDIDVNSTGASSSWWIISAYNSGYGSTGDNLGSPSNITNDYVKVLALVSQNPTTPPGNGVPEPGSLALIGAGLVGLLAARRGKKQRDTASA